MPYKTKPCPKCGKPIRGNNATCRDCVDWSAVNRIPSASDYTLERICQSCGKSFRITHSRQYFCDECRTLSCAVCGKPFKTVFGKERLTCSPECSAILNTAPTLRCEWCGTEYKRRNGHDTRYCSKECRYEAAHRYNAPERRSYRYKRWRREVLERDNYTCQQCGSTENLQVHHIKDFEHHYELRFEVTNGVTLCRWCHSKEHGGKTIIHTTPRQPICCVCGKPTKGRAERCRSCAMKLSPKAQAYRATLRRSEKGTFTR